MKNFDDWKRRVFERVKSEIYSEMDWGLFSKQMDEYYYVYGGPGIMEGLMPPHGKLEIWLDGKLEKEILKEFREAAKRDGKENIKKEGDSPKVP